MPGCAIAATEAPATGSDPAHRWAARRRWRWDCRSWYEERPGRRSQAAEPGTRLLVKVCGYASLSFPQFNNLEDRQSRRAAAEEPAGSSVGDKERGQVQRLSIETSPSFRPSSTETPSCQ